MEHIREAVVGAGLASDEEVDGIVAELYSFASNPQDHNELAQDFSGLGEEILRPSAGPSNF